MMQAGDYEYEELVPTSLVFNGVSYPVSVHTNSDLDSHAPEIALQNVNG